MITAEDLLNEMLSAHIGLDQDVPDLYPARFCFCANRVVVAGLQADGL